MKAVIGKWWQFSTKVKTIFSTIYKSYSNGSYNVYHLLTMTSNKTNSNNLDMGPKSRFQWPNHQWCSVVASGNPMPVRTAVLHKTKTKEHHIILIYDYWIIHAFYFCTNITVIISDFVIYALGIQHGNRKSSIYNHIYRWLSHWNLIPHRILDCKVWLPEDSI